MLETLLVYGAYAYLGGRFLQIGVINLGSWLSDLGSLTHKQPSSDEEQPLISIIIPTYNNQGTIEACLDSILSSQYQNCQIIVADGKSTDNTKDVVKQFIEDHPDRSIRLHAKRKRATRQQAIYTAFENWAKGDLVLVITPQHRLLPDTLDEAVTQLKTEPVGALRLHEVAIPRIATYHLINQTQSALNHQLQQLGDLSGLTITSKVTATLWKPKALKNLRSVLLSNSDNNLGRLAAELQQQEINYSYAGEAQIYYLPAPFKQLLKRFFRRQLAQIQGILQLIFSLGSKGSLTRRLANGGKLIVRILNGSVHLYEPIALVYLTWVAVNFGQSTLFVVAWLAVALLYGLAIWANRQLPWTHKLLLSLFIPAFLSVYAAMAILRSLVILASLLLIIVNSLSRWLAQLQPRLITRLQPW